MKEGRPEHRKRGKRPLFSLYSLYVCLINFFALNAIAETPFTAAIDRTFQLFAQGQLPPPEEVDAFLKDIATSDFAPATLIGILSNSPSFGHNPNMAEEHLRSVGLAGTLILNTKLNAEGGRVPLRSFAAKLAFNSSMQRQKFASWYTALIKQKALRYLADSNQTTKSERKLMVGDLATNLISSALSGNVPAAHEFIRNFSWQENKEANSKACMVLFVAKIGSEEIRSACSADKIGKSELQNWLVETLAETEIKQRNILSSKFLHYQAVMCTNFGLAIEDRLKCTAKLSAAIELCRATDISAKYKVIEGQFLCDKRALIAIGNIVDDLFKQMQSN